MNIRLVRHGQTRWNVGEVFRGHADVDLDDIGKKQAELLAGYLSQTPVDFIYTSPLVRAIKTAEKIAGTHRLTPQVAPELIDLNYGEWQGLTHPEASEKYPELYREWQEHPEKTRLPGGETLEEARERSMVLVNSLISRNGQSVLLVSHRVIIKLVTCALLGLDNSHFWNIKIDNCGLTTFLYDGRFVLTGHNDTSFLKPLQGRPLSDF